MKRAATVDDYIANAPKDVQPKLKELRSAIKAAVPKAEESISYGMPYYKYKGKLAYFGVFKDHVSLFAIPPIIKEHKNELKKYLTSTSTIRFPLDEQLPIALIKKLVRARVKKNEEAKKK